MILEDNGSYCDCYNSECKYGYNNAIVDEKRNNIDANCDIDRTNKHKSSSTVIKSNNNDDNDSDNGDGDNYNSKSNDDESFSFFLSSSFDDISKSFGRVLDITAIESCHNPFNYYCLPITIMSATNKNDNGNEEEAEAEEFQTYETIDGDEEEETRPYVTFRLPLECEYCGCPSIHECHLFGPNCRRPETFFPKVKSPFVVVEQQ
mmetsp:Transcript_60/g.58  ORF Transcript_60/g.58 Transcript_60/m.58 type:complete len:205 (+) Transcript_60:374-988(+)